MKGHPKFVPFITQHYGTKAQFGREMGVTYITAFRWCNRPQMMSIEQVEKIAKHTRVDVCEVISKMK
jgi:hypothetical protein